MPKLFLIPTLSIYLSLVSLSNGIRVRNTPEAGSIENSSSPVIKKNLLGRLSEIRKTNSCLK